MSALVGQYWRIEVGDGRAAFVRKADLASDSGKAPQELEWEPILSRSPPHLKVSAASLATREDQMSLELLATDENGGVQDMFVFVGNRKVFYKPNPAADPSEMKLTLDVPLKPGVNVITVVARENADTSTRHRVVVRRDGPDGQILPTPRNEVFGEDWEFGAP